MFLLVHSIINCIRLFGVIEPTLGIMSQYEQYLIKPCSYHLPGGLTGQSSPALFLLMLDTTSFVQ